MRSLSQLSWAALLLPLVLAAAGLVLGDKPPGPAAPPEANAPPEPADAQARAKVEQEYELFRLFAETLDQVERNYHRPVDRKELMENAIRGMLARLDPHSAFIAPEELDQFRTGIESEFGGVGIQIGLIDGQLTITSPIVGTPAWKAGLMAGDRILKIAGQETKGLSLDEVTRRFKGPAGEKVVFSIFRPSTKQEEEYTLERQLIRVDTVLGDRRNADDAWEFMLDDERKIAYIRITAFGRHTADELRTALIKLTERGMKALVLDLRFNPGGLLTSGIAVADLFVDQGLIVSTEGRSIPKREYRAERDGTFRGFPIAVLVNRYSASASEIVAACLQDHRLAVVVGERSFGKGSVQNVIELAGGKSALKLTTSGYHRPSGENIHRHPGDQETAAWGVRPDEGYEVKPAGEEELTAYLKWRRERDLFSSRNVPPGGMLPPAFDDKQLAKAVEYLRERLSTVAQAETPRDE